MRAFILICAIALSGCCGTKQVLTSTPVAIDKRVLEPCKDLKIPEDPLTYEKILEITRDNTLLYKECKSKNDGAIILIKKLSNQKDF